MHSDQSDDSTEKEYTQIPIPVSQLPFYEQQGWEFVENLEHVMGVPITCAVRRYIGPR